MLFLCCISDKPNFKVPPYDVLSGAVFVGIRAPVT